MRRFVLVWFSLWAFLVQQHAWAQAQPGDFLRYGTNSVQAVGMPGIGTADFDRFMGRVLNGSSGSIVADVRLNGSIRGATVPFTVTQTFPAAAAARAVSRALGIAGAGLAIAALVNETRCRNTGTPILPIFECDLGEPGSGGMTPIVGCFGMQTYSQGFQPQCWSSAQAVLSAWIAHQNSSNGCATGTQGVLVYCAQPGSCTNGGSTSWNCTFTKTRSYDGHTTNESATVVQGVPPAPPACPSGLARSTLGGVAFCPTGTYSPSTESNVADRVGANPGFQGNPAPPVIGAGQVGSQPQGGTTTIGAPGTVNLPSTTRTGQGTGGGTWSETAVPVATTTCQGDTCTWTITTTTTRTNRDAQGNVISTEVSTETDGTGTQGDVITCGLPNTPPCKIDERGTPDAGTASSVLASATQQLDQAADLRQTQIENQGGSARQTTLPWSWAFPSVVGTCTNPSTTIKGRTFAPDLCGSQYTAWFRELLAWALAMATAVYCWQRASALGK